MSVPQLERRFRERKSLGLRARAESHMRQQVAASPNFAAIFFTDRNGLKVAMTNPTSDFVQFGEECGRTPGAWRSHRRGRVRRGHAG